MPKIQDQRSEVNKNPLYCHWCGKYKFVECKEYTIEKGWNTIWIKNFNYRCRSCWSTEASILKNFVNHPSFNNDRFVLWDDWYLRLSDPDRVASYSSLGLKYDWLDYYGIPWFARMQDDWSLTPVFFKKDLLNFFNHHPEYKVKMYWWSVASIFKKSEKWREELADRGIGVNRNGRLFVFLWDLADYLRHWSITDEELSIWKATNVDSDHDVISDLYFQQIEVCFTKPDNERGIFDHIIEINSLSNQIYWFELFEFDYDKVDESYKYSIFNEKDQIARSVNLLCQFIVESINKEWIKNYLESVWKNINSQKWQELWSNKLFSQFILTITKDNLTNWLFILYDFEIVLWHKKSPRWHEEMIKSCFARLSIVESSDYLYLFKKIVEEIITNFETLKLILVKKIESISSDS